MIDTLIADNMITILIALILATTAIIMVKRDILSIITTYKAQSFLIVLIAIALYTKTGHNVLISIALLTLISKTIIIPKYIKHIHKQLNIRRDVEFRHLSSTKALFINIFIILASYIFLKNILQELSSESSFFFGAIVGLSLTFTGMFIIYNRKKVITHIIGFLIMDNGVLLFSLFITDLPMIIEMLIIVDLVIITLLATILAFGIDSTVNEFHAKLNVIKKAKNYIRSKKKKTDTTKEKIKKQIPKRKIE